MADAMMNQPPQGPPPGGGRPPIAGNDPMSKNRSALNPSDMAYMKKSGQITPDMTFGQFLETSFGIKWDDPLQVAGQKLQKSSQNADPMKKMQNIANTPAGPGMEGQMPEGPRGPQKPMPQGRKPMVQSGGLEGLVGRM